MPCTVPSAVSTTSHPSPLETPSENQSRSVSSDSLRPHGLYSPWNSPGQNAGVGSLSLLQGIFPTQGLNPGLLHCRQILYQLSRKGSPSTCVNPGTKDTAVECSHKRILGPEQPLHLISPLAEARPHVPPLLCGGGAQVGTVTHTEDTGP